MTQIDNDCENTKTILVFILQGSIPLVITHISNFIEVVLRFYPKVKSFIYKVVATKIAYYCLTTVLLWYVHNLLQYNGQALNNNKSNFPFN